MNIQHTCRYIEPVGAQPFFNRQKLQLHIPRQPGHTQSLFFCASRTFSPYLWIYATNSKWTNTALSDSVLYCKYKPNEYTQRLGPTIYIGTTRSNLINRQSPQNCPRSVWHRLHEVRNPKVFCLRSSPTNIVIYHSRPSKQRYNHESTFNIMEICNYPICISVMVNRLRITLMQWLEKNSTWDYIELATHS